MKALLDIKIDDPLRDNIIQCCILQSTHAAFHNTFGEYICIGNDLWILLTQNLVYTTDYKSEKCNYHEYLSDKRYFVFHLHLSHINLLSLWQLR